MRSTSESLRVDAERTDRLFHNPDVSLFLFRLFQLSGLYGINPENAAKAIQEELAVIEAGLEALKPPPGSLPENEWS
ncbi:hypothetical protein BjapCC829_07320 [Bradyrhizobium barranii]|uniref:Uncharacterized protein n=1 Tax=Bradyrhizobium barranii TaxID=2992140 RepID=A0ABY3QTI4_9BRAD|nr:hypothetical protein [Bradyrhizobium japonicum]UFW88362.1 hypothetical protein BjapCC829_07320 [Bradyrhizobium japonicum]